MVNYAFIGKALIHPTAAKILRALDESDEPLSPNLLSQMLGEPLGNVSYHVKVLAGDSKRSAFGAVPAIELTRTVPRRGALEHFYALTPVAEVDA